jgi:hypothetical protein
MAAPNRNQHWVPQFYLKYFATPESADAKHPQIWAFPIDEGEEILVSTRNVAAKRDLYTLCGSEVDERLTDLEGFLATYWPRFANQHCAISDAFKKTLALFISTSYLRHPRELERQRRLQAAWNRIIGDAPRDQAGNIALGTVTFNDQPVPLEPGELQSLADESDEALKKRWGEIILSETGRLALHLLERPWAVLFTEKPAFVTTDHPVVLVNQWKNEPDFYSPETVIYLPISPTRLVVIGNRKYNGMTYPVLRGGEALFNYLIFKSAHRFVFSPWDPISLMRQVIRVGDWIRAEIRAPVIEAAKIAHAGIGRNDPCPCGSGLKFKKCCIKLQWTRDPRVPLSWG